MPSSPLIVLGLDAGDPTLLTTWAASGRLPTLAALMRRGSWGRTGGPELVIEHGAWLSLATGLSRARREELLAQQFAAGTDWARTTAYALPTTYTTMIRVNLRGREPQGLVQPGAEYEAVLSHLEADFAALVDPVTGGPAVLRVDRAAALFGGEPPRLLPDLLVEWQPARHFLERVAHPQGDLHQRRPEFFRSTDHSRTGFLIAAGPDIAAQGEWPAAFDVLDLAPTALALLGQPAPAALTGRVAGFVQPRS